MDWYAWSDFAESLLLSISEASLRAVVLAVMAGLLALLLRRNANAQRTLWTLVVIGMLALPLVRPFVPVTYVHTLKHPEALRPAVQFVAEPSARIVAIAAGPASLQAQMPDTRRPWPFYLATVYIIGVLLFAARMLGALLLTHRWLRGARPLPAHQAFELIGDSIINIDVAESDRLRVPVTTGFMRMQILLPAAWRKWTTDKIKLVLAHELSHAAHYDPLIRILAAANKCIFWFHPLAWWLERHLAALAEDAADDAALAASSDPDRYARVLLDVASSMQGHSMRVLWHASAITGQQITRRIRRVLNSGAQTRSRRLPPFIPLLASALLVVASLAIDVQSAAHAQTKQPPAGATSGFGYRVEGPEPGPLTVAQVEEMERRLARDPEDEAIRTKLLDYYWKNELHNRRIPLVLWLIEHHPESAVHGRITATTLPYGPGTNRAVFEEATRKWLAQAALHPEDPRVLGNAARSIGDGHLPEAIDLLKRAQKLDPSNRTVPLARLYSFLLIFSTSQNTHRSPLRNASLAAQARSELLSSTDIALVGTTARHVVEQATMEVMLGRFTWDLQQLRAIAIELVTHAQVLDPNNQAWSDLMEGVKGLPTVSPRPPA